MAGNGERLKESQRATAAKGRQTWTRSWRCRTTTPPPSWRSASAVLAKYNRLQRLLAESAEADEDKKAETFAEAAALAREVMPILHFKVDDVDWDD